MPNCPRHFGTGAEVSRGHFGTSAEMSWVRSVLGPKCPYTIPWCHCKHKHREEPVKDVIFGWLFRYIGLLFSYEYRHTVRHYSVLKHAAIKTYWHFLYDNYILRARARCASAVNLLLSVRTSHDVIASLWLAVCFCLVQSDCVCAAYVMRYQCSLAGPP